MSTKRVLLIGGLVEVAIGISLCVAHAYGCGRAIGIIGDVLLISGVIDLVISYFIKS